MKLNQSGLTLIGVSLGIGIVGILFLSILAGINSIDAGLSQNRLAATKDRILSSVRTLASMPAALRNSMVAGDSSGNPINVGLFACAGGNPLNSCNHQQQYPLTLYSPVVTFAGGVPVSIQPISSPIGGAASALRFDTYGVPCTTTGPECPLLVSTAFKATCGSAPRDPLLPVTAAMFVPPATCTIADSVEVIYQVQLDPALLSTHPELATFASGVSGTVSVPVQLISGNVAQ